MPERLSPVRAISATSLAISEPSDIATDTLASARAGVSFMPSPTITTLWPFDFNAATYSLLCSGITCDWYISSPKASDTRSAAGSASPVSIHIRLKPRCLSSLIIPAASSLTGSSITIIPASSPPMLKNMAELPMLFSSMIFLFSSLRDTPSSSKTKCAEPITVRFP